MKIRQDTMGVARNDVHRPIETDIHSSDDPYRSSPFQSQFEVEPTQPAPVVPHKNNFIIGVYRSVSCVCYLVFCFVALSYLVFCCLVLSCACAFSSRLVLAWIGLSFLVLPCPVLFCPVLSCLCTCACTYDSACACAGSCAGSCSGSGSGSGSCSGSCSCSCSCSCSLLLLLLLLPCFDLF